MNKEFIPYEQALELKELGFDEPCLAYYNKKELFSFTQVCNEPLKGHYIKMSNRLCTPTFSQAFRWFREKYKFVGTVLGDGFNGQLKGYYFSITEEGWINFYESIDEGKWYDTYEEAELACLKKLIEIVRGGEQ